MKKRLFNKPMIIIYSIEIIFSFIMGVRMPQGERLEVFGNMIFYLILLDLLVIFWFWWDTESPMAEFRKTLPQNQKKVDECPYCHSKNVRKITKFDIGISILLSGVEKSCLGKNWHCNNCEHDFY